MNRFRVGIVTALVDVVILLVVADFWFSGPRNHPATVEWVPVLGDGPP